MYSQIKWYLWTQGIYRCKVTGLECTDVQTGLLLCKAFFSLIHLRLQLKPPIFTLFLENLFQRSDKYIVKLRCSNTFGSKKICLRQRQFKLMSVNHSTRSGGIIRIYFRFSLIRYVVLSHLNCLIEVILMSKHNTCIPL